MNINWQAYFITSFAIIITMGVCTWNILDRIDENHLEMKKHISGIVQAEAHIINELNETKSMSDSLKVYIQESHNCDHRYHEVLLQYIIGLYYAGQDSTISKPKRRYKREEHKDSGRGILF